MEKQQPRPYVLSVACPGPEHLEPLATALSRELQPGDVLLLFGPLGAGKTTLTQALARALGVGDDQYVSSPSFALLHEYEGTLPIAHMDLYRLADEDDVEAAGLMDYLGGKGISIIEWPERLGELTPATRLDIIIEPIDGDLRHIHLQPQGSAWQHRLSRLATRLSEYEGVHLLN